jgi:diamine N-acetyltransferase
MTQSTEPVTLREITAETLREILRLEVSEAQKKFVASNAVSIAQAHFSENAWFRAIYAGETPVGFVMVYINTDEADYFLWRYMIDARYQGKGYGFLAIHQVIEYIKTLPNATSFSLSYHPDEGSPAPFYEKCGFVETNKVIEGERVMTLKFLPEQ